MKTSGPTVRARRLLRRLVSLGAIMVPPPPGLWFFVFHSVGYGANPALQPERIELTPSRFAGALDWIRRHFEVISCAEGLELLRGGVPGGLRAAVLTVDDGYRDFMDHGFPLLRRLALPFSIYVNSAMIENEELAWRHRVVYLQRHFADALPAQATEFLTWSKARFEHPGTVERLDQIWRCHVDREHERRLARRIYLGWEDLATMRADHTAPVAIGNHTAHHWVLSRLPEPVLREEIAGCHRALADRFHALSPFLAIPHGGPEHSNETVHRMADEVGYVSFFGRGWHRAGERLYPLASVRRVEVTLRRPAPLAVLEHGILRPWRAAVERVQYLRYLRDQVWQTRAKRHKDARFRLVPFVDIVRRHCPDLGPEARILSIGPRNEIELDVFTEAGFTNITGIDLYSRSSRVRRMDMHRLKFPDATFDLVFGSHVFEHAWDLGRVAHEVIRVLKPKGHVFCAVPRGGEPNWHDRHRFDTPEDVIAYFGHAEPEILYQETRPQEIRLLFRVSRA